MNVINTRALPAEDESTTRFVPAATVVLASVVAPTNAPDVVPFAIVQTTVEAGFSTVMLPAVVSCDTRNTPVMVTATDKPEEPNTDTAVVPLVSAATVK